MKVFKKSLLLIICVLLIVGASLSVFAAEDDNTSLADYLKEMGLFKGSDAGYRLEDTATRAEAALMVVRLLGKEDEVLAQKIGHPFTDVPDWASPYVGYLYKNGISKGISDTLYGAKDLTNSLQYMTFLLRILEYDDALGDFTWKQSIQKAYELGILTDTEYQFYGSNPTFLRDDLVVLTYDALDGDIKDGNGITLIRRLMDEKVVPQNAMLKYLYAPYFSGSDYSHPKNIEEFQAAILQGIVAYKDTLELDVSNILVTNALDQVYEATERTMELPAYASILDSISVYKSEQVVTINFNYRITKEEFDQTIIQADKVGLMLPLSDKSDYERELLIHDYIVDNCQYYLGNDDQDNIYTMYGLFINKQAVCQAYADAFFYLATYAGLEAQLVYGVATDGSDSILHAWNTIELEGENYNLDPTWDDPLSPDGLPIKQYDYFNITNEEMSIDHTWLQGDYPVSNGTKYNYYVYNNLVVYGEQGLRTAIGNGLNERKQQMIFKVKDYEVSTEQLCVILDSLPGFSRCSYSVNGEKGIVEILNIQY